MTVETIRADQLQDGDVLESFDGLVYTVDSPEDLPGGWARYWIDVTYTAYDRRRREYGRYEQTKPCDELVRVVR